MSGKRHSETYYEFKRLYLKATPMPYTEEKVWVDLLSEFIDENEYELARKACLLAKEQHPYSEAFCLSYIQILIYLNQPQQARIEIEPYKNEDMQEVAALLFGIECAEGKIDEAFEHMIERLKTKKVSPEIFTYAISDYWDAIKDKNIANHLVSATEHFGKEAKMMTEIAIYLRDIGQLELSNRVFEHSLDIDAYYLKNWHNLINNHYQLGNLDKCIECCDFGIAIDPECSLFHFAKALSLSQKDRTDEAIAELIQSKKLLIYRLQDGTIAEELNSEEEGYQQLVTILLSLGECYMKKGDKDMAFKTFRDAYEIDDSDPDVNYNLTTHYYEMGDLASSSMHIDKAIEAEPSNKQYLSLKVAIQTAKYEFEDALKTLDSILKYHPRSQNFLFIKAELALHLKKQELADATFRRLLKLNPKNEFYRTTMLHFFQNIGDEEAVRKLEKK